MKILVELIWNYPIARDVLRLDGTVQNGNVTIFILSTVATNKG